MKGLFARERGKGFGQCPEDQATGAAEKEGGPQGSHDENENRGLPQRVDHKHLKEKAYDDDEDDSD